MASELEQFCVIARSQKDRACANIIQQVLKDKKIHVFGELLAVPSVQALKGTEFNNAYETLELFAYGSFDDYTASPARFLELTPFMTQKLRRLTLFSMAAKSNKLAYDDLLAALQLQTVRDLEDFVIDAVYSELIAGKLDQMGQVFTVSWVTARDVRREDLGAVLDKLTRWRERCTTTKTILQKSSRDVFQKGAVYAVENSEVQRKADIEREKLKALVEAGEMDCDDDFIGGRRERSKPGSSRSSALDRLGLGIGGGIGGGRSSASHMASTRSKF